MEDIYTIEEKYKTWKQYILSLTFMQEVSKYFAERRHKFRESNRVQLLFTDTIFAANVSLITSCQEPITRSEQRSLFGWDIVFTDRVIFSFQFPAKNICFLSGTFKVQLAVDPIWRNSPIHLNFQRFRTRFQRTNRFQTHRYCPPCL